MLITSEAGKLYSWKPPDGRLTEVFSIDNSEHLMGIDKMGDHIFLGANSCLFKINISQNYSPQQVQKSKSFHRKQFVYRKLKFREIDPAFHHLNIIKGSLYIAATRFNEI